MWLYDGIYEHTGWWLSLPLWKMMEWTSIGMMTFPTEWKHTIHVPNHHPVVVDHDWIIIPTLGEHEKIHGSKMFQTTRWQASQDLNIELSIEVSKVNKQTQFQQHIHTDTWPAPSAQKCPNPSGLRLEMTGKIMFQWLWCRIFHTRHGNLWQFMALYGNLWQFIAFYGNLWQFIALYGNFWQFHRLNY